MTEANLFDLILRFDAAGSEALRGLSQGELERVFERLEEREKLFALVAADSVILVDGGRSW